MLMFLLGMMTTSIIYGVAYWLDKKNETTVYLFCYIPKWQDTPIITNYRLIKYETDDFDKMLIKVVVEEVHEYQMG